MKRKLIAVALAALLALPGSVFAWGWGWSGGGGTTSPAAIVGGSDTHVQFNDGGTAFGGDAGLAYNKTLDILSAGGATIKGWTVYKGLQLGQGGAAVSGASTESTVLSSNWYFDGAGKYIADGYAARIMLSSGQLSFQAAASGSAGGAITWVTPLVLGATENYLPTGQFINYYNTADQTTNYERAFAKWDTNVFKIGTEKGGSGTLRTAGLYVGTSYVNINGSSTIALGTSTGILNFDGATMYPSGGAVSLGSAGGAFTNIFVGTGGLQYFHNLADMLTNYERAYLKWDTNVFKIGVEKGGTGTARAMWITPGSGSYGLAIGTSAAVDFTAAGGGVQIWHTGSAPSAVILGDYNTEANQTGILMRSTDAQLRTSTNGTLRFSTATNMTQGLKLLANSGVANVDNGFDTDLDTQSVTYIPHIKTTDATADVELMLDHGGVGTGSSGVRMTIPASTTWGFKILLTARQSAAAMTAASFTGTGLNDATRGGTFTGQTAARSYRVEIDGTGTPDTFKWSNDGGSTWTATTVAITGAAQTLSEGVTVTFAATTGHTSGDRWDWTTAGYIGCSSQWEYTGMIKRNASNSTALVGSVTTTLIAQDTAASAWAATVDANDTNEALRVKVTGEADKTIKWLARVTTNEI